MKTIIAASKQGHWQLIDSKLIIQGEELLSEEYSLTLNPRVVKGAKSLSNNKGIISLDLNITKELEQEGIARDIIRLVQQARKDAGFEVSDRIILEIKSKFNITEVINHHGDFISDQTLSTFKTVNRADYQIQSVLNDNDIEILICKLPQQ